jgi:hypothetical protein
VVGASNAVAVPSVDQLTGVTPNPDRKGFIAVCLGAEWRRNRRHHRLSYASSPTGLWTAPQPVYTIRQISQDQSEVAYMPTFHPELSSANSLVVSYNINTTLGLSGLLQDVHRYQPHFLLISG